jgi:hypothetical protein
METKKEYTTPEIEVIELDRQPLLIVPGSDTKRWGGEID